MIRYILLFGLMLGTAFFLNVHQAFPYEPPPPKQAYAPKSTLSEAAASELVSFSFSESASYYKRVQGYEYIFEEGKHTVYFWLADSVDEPYPAAVDQAWVDGLNAIIRQYNMSDWDGFHGSFDGLLDGTSFSVSFDLSDGTSVYAHGYGLFPNNYNAASAEIDAYFMQLLPENMRDW